MTEVKQYTHKCIKPVCPNSYTDSDPDAYYCKPCQEENKKIAAMVDAKLKSRPSKRRMSALEEYNSLPKGKFGYPIFRP